MKRTAAVAKAVKRFERFHDRAPNKVGLVEIPHPKAVVFLGAGVAIEYRSDKHVLSLGDKVSVARGKTRLYRHLFGPGVKVYTDPEGQALIIIGGKFRVTDWMRD
jgi:hypothetical protein